MLTVTTWLWGMKYPEAHVRKLASAVKRNLKQPYRFICFTDSPRLLTGIEQFQIIDPHLTAEPGCFVRLRIFDPVWQARLGIARGDRIVNIDLDAVVTGPLDDIFAIERGFTILQGINTTNPCPYNGSLWMLQAGWRPDVWSQFSLGAARKVPFHSFPDDQGWFHHMMPDAEAFGPDVGVYGFKKLGWPPGDALPAGAKVVAFPGWRDPQKFEHIDWIKANWR